MILNGTPFKHDSQRYPAFKHDSQRSSFKHDSQQYPLNMILNGPHLNMILNSTL